MDRDAFVAMAPADEAELAKLAFLEAIREMQEGQRPVDVEYLVHLADFVFDAHAHMRDGSRP
jgi:hypothetical protein